MKKKQDDIELLVQRAMEEDADKAFPDADDAGYGADTDGDVSDIVDETAEMESKGSERTSARSGKSAGTKQESERDEKARKAFRKLTDLDEEGESGMSLRTILGGDILAGRWFRRQIAYVLLLAVLAIIYVSNRYACQREEIRRDDLADTLVDRKFKALTISSRLTEFSMRSNVEENLSDTTLKTSMKSSYYVSE